MRTNLESVTKGIYPLRRSRRGGTAKVEEYLPGVSGMLVLGLSADMGL